MEKSVKPICNMKNFSLDFQQDGKLLRAVNSIDLEIHAGEMVALIGESGCGKTMTALSLIGLTPENAKLSGSIQFKGQELLQLKEEEWETYRGNRISMIFQEPMTALNPLIKVGKQIGENIHIHRKVTKEEEKEEVLAMLHMVGLPDVERISQCYPHQLSGGQRQRVMIAMAFVNKPDLLLADEPTTALDVTIQAQIMELMKKMNQETHTAVLLISHDLGVIRNMCSRVYIMYAGRIVESGRVSDVLEDPIHPYTRGLVAAIPSAGKKGKELYSIPGTVPALDQRSNQGCPFSNRCFAADACCEDKTPAFYPYMGRKIFCHFSPDEIDSKSTKEE